MKFSAFVAVSMALAASAGPSFVRRASFTLQNGKDAIALNQKFQSLTPNSSCQTGEDACIDNKFAQCVNGKFVLQQCGGGLICAALPLVNSAGTSITCTTAADRDARIAATGATDASNNAATGNAASSSAAASSTSSAAAASGTAAGGGNSNDPQQSLTLLQSVIATGFENDGQDQPTAGQVPSLTSSNNFINFCATVPNLPITNGQQIKTGSCNPAPMGVIAATTNMPSSKFQFPTNNAKIPANQNFTIKMAIQHLETGHFTNANENYFAAPQVVNAQGDIQGHSHVVVEQIDAVDTTKVTDPTKFVFFKGLNDQAVNGVLSVEVGGGLPKGAYRLASINTAANHQPALVAVAQHGSLDDMVYFTVE
ncbi:hypothetical protein C8Q70DRAFT_1055291 [Cubamyces menziesii]|uniref:Carbohydrate-binding module family 19 domain-containing protein n=1 Tax=Trametes cubensis TaxID=1111947 RepID=A0AAD7U1Q1_9APHY|nr:hypothetical protein C8Q70DRAFT_1055291 [Cubamyces menziesii]KAJ8490000.1 hypothetical protein ONZ51_g2567 [Trametes cubensis]